MFKKVLSFVFVVGFFTGVAFGQVYKNYDRFKDQTSLSSISPLDASERSLADGFAGLKPPVFFGVVWKGTDISPLEFQELLATSGVFGVVTSHSEDWRFLGEEEVFILVNRNTPVVTTFVNNSGSVRNGVNETITFNVTYEEFQKIMSATKIEFKIGTYDWSISDSNIEEIIHFGNILAYNAKEKN